MDDKRIDGIVASIYLKLYLDYSATGVGNYTDKGRLVTKEILDMFQKRLQHYIIKIKEK
jgi:hypothetical protein|tara:strand:- start:349 stop:525 length:177 start_codon:yes stop_codon:yes gene_type:complete